MNAAFLLVTTAWLAGADAPPPPKVEPPPPAVTAQPVVSGAPCSSCGGTSGYGGGCSSCDSGCGEHEGFFAKLKAKFAHGGDCGCAASTCSSCDSGCGGEGFLSKLKGKFSSGGCGCGGHESHHASGCSSCGAAPACGCESGPSFFERLKAKFSHGGECGCGGDTGCSSGCSSCGSSGYGAPAYGTPVGAPPVGEPVKPPKDGDPGKKLPEGKDGKEVHVPATFQIAPASQTIEQETKNPFELDRRYEKRVDRAADYSWLTGQLFYVHADGGLWVLRYAPLSKEDSNGGGVVLARDLPMDSYREGDLVTVHGAVLKLRGAPVLGAPLYQASSIELVERSQP